MTLCIVDMQPYFTSSDRIVCSVIREIERAKRNGSGIVVLEFVDCGSTYREIVDAIKDYDRKTFTKKSDDDGSGEFIGAAKRAGFSTNYITVVGVNRAYCVAYTVAGLMNNRKVKKIRVVEDATWGHEPEEEMKELWRLSKHPCGKVRIV